MRLYTVGLGQRMGHIGVWRTPVRVLNAKESEIYHKGNTKELEDTGTGEVRQIIKGNDSVKYASDYKKMLPKSKLSESAITSLTGIDFQDLRLSGDEILREQIDKIQNKKYRQNKKRIVLEGRNLIQDALSCGVVADTIFISNKGVQYLDDMDINQFVVNGTKVRLVSERMMKECTDVVTHPGLLGIFRMPSSSFESDSSIGSSVEEVDAGLSNSSSRLPVTVICDDVRLPDNVATVLRSVVAAGCARVILAPGCCDVWERKVLRGAAGAHFRVPIIQNHPWSHIYNYMDMRQTQVYICNSSAGCSLYDVDFTERLRAGGTDATGSGHHICVVLGNEVRGVTNLPQHHRPPPADATQSPINVHIPMMNGMESINVGMAATVLCFEIQRQLMLMTKRNREK